MGETREPVVIGPYSLSNHCQAQTIKTRIPWIDHLKAFGIFLVVYGHSHSVPWGIGQWIYAFHMPLFFFVSGYLLSTPQSRHELPKCIQHQLLSLLPPYLTFSAIGYSFWILAGRHFDHAANGPASPILTLLMIPFGSGTAESIHLEPSVLWFFPCLLVCQIVTLALSLLPTRSMCVLSVALACIGFMLPKDVILPFEIETALVAQSFATLGLLAHKYHWVEYLSTKKTIFPVALVCLGSAIGLLNDRINMRSSDYGTPIYFLLGAVLMIYGLSGIFSRINQMRISWLLSSNSILIFPLHPLVFSLIFASYVYVFHLNLSFRERPLVGLFASALNCALVVLMAPIFRKWIPWSYGIKPNKAVEPTPVAVASPS